MTHLNIFGKSRYIYKHPFLHTISTRQSCLVNQNYCLTLVQKLKSSLGDSQICLPHPIQVGKERLKKNTNHSILLDGSCNKPEKLHMRLVLGFYKRSRFPHLPCGILRVNIEDSIGLSHVHSPDGLSNPVLS